MARQPPGCFQPKARRRRWGPNDGTHPVLGLADEVSSTCAKSLAVRTDVIDVLQVTEIHEGAEGRAHHQRLIGGGPQGRSRKRGLCSNKHAVCALSEGLRQQVKPNNIRTTVISPAAVATELPDSVPEPDVAGNITEVLSSGRVSSSIVCTVCRVRDKPAGRDLNLHDDALKRPSDFTKRQITGRGECPSFERVLRSFQAGMILATLRSTDAVVSILTS